LDFDEAQSFKREEYVAEPILEYSNVAGSAVKRMSDHITRND